MHAHTFTNILLSVDHKTKYLRNSTLSIQLFLIIKKKTELYMMENTQV